MVADELRHPLFPAFQQKPHHGAERVDKQCLLVRRLFLQKRFADVEDVADVHAVDAVQLHLFRRVAQNLLDRLPQRPHLFQQNYESGIRPGVSHGCFPRRRCCGSPPG